jgi:exosortase/archaeosortase family protein
LSRERLEDYVRFLGTFMLLAVPLYALIYLKADFRWAQESVAAQVAWLARLVGAPAVAEGYLVKSGNVILEIVDACVAWKDIFAFAALIIAVPRRGVRGKLWGILAGAVLIYSVNILRLLTVLLVALRWPGMADLVHSLLWKFGMIGFLLFLWIVWLSLTATKPRRKKAK